MNIYLKLLPIIVITGLYTVNIKKAGNIRYYFPIGILFTLLSFIPGYTAYDTVFTALIIHILLLLHTGKNVSIRKILSKIMDFNILILCITICLIVFGKTNLTSKAIVIYPLILLTLYTVVLFCIEKSYKYIPISCILSLFLIMDLLSIDSSLVIMLGLSYILILSLHENRSIEADILTINKNLKKEVSFTHRYFKEIQDSIYNECDISTIFNNILDGVLDTLNADSGAFFLINNDVAQKICSSEDFVDMDIKKINIKPSLIKCTEAKRNRSYNRYADNMADYVSSLIIRPIIFSQESSGLMILQNNQYRKKFTERDFNRSEIFSTFANIALENLEKKKELLKKKEIDNEIKIAAEIQKNLVKDTVKTKDLSISVISKPAEGMNGDYFNILPLPEGKYLIIICDVAGKGIPAAIVTVIVNTVTSIISKQINKASTLLTWINQALVDQVNIERYATMACMIIDPQLKTITYANAGHHPCLLKRGKSIMRITTEGLPVGIVRDTKYKNVTLKYDKNDSLLMYTDGIIETMNSSGEQYSEDSIIQVFLSSDNDHPLHTVSTIFQQTDDFSYKGFKHDDRTIIGVNL